MDTDNVIRLHSYNRWIKNLRTTVHTTIRSDHFIADQSDEGPFYFCSSFDKGGAILDYVTKENPSLCSLEGGPGDNRLVLTASDTAEAEMVLRSLEREWDRRSVGPESACAPK